MASSWDLDIAYAGADSLPITACSRIMQAYLAGAPEIPKIPVGSKQKTSRTLTVYAGEHVEKVHIAARRPRCATGEISREAGVGPLP